MRGRSHQALKCGDARHQPQVNDATHDDDEVEPVPHDVLAVGKEATPSNLQAHHQLEDVDDHQDLLRERPDPAILVLHLQAHQDRVERYDRHHDALKGGALGPGHVRLNEEPDDLEDTGKPCDAQDPEGAKVTGVTTRAQANHKLNGAAHHYDKIQPVEDNRGELANEEGLPLDNQVQDQLHLVEDEEQHVQDGEIIAWVNELQVHGQEVAQDHERAEQHEPVPQHPTKTRGAFVRVAIDFALEIVDLVL
mmetsp:Transcript_5221/g.16071  ORF Transcript_5221/g.16071 Transcript_5221/m.16071 type:complete len:250 (+) Transcript_5221:863-1612(+)